MSYSSKMNERSRAIETEWGKKRSILKKKRRLKLHKDAFIHSDQGCHYISPQYQKLLKKQGLGQSLSRRGNCWDNAPQESFYGHMKDDVISRNCSTLEELRLEVNSVAAYS